MIMIIECKRFNFVKKHKYTKMNKTCPKWAMLETVMCK